MARYVENIDGNKSQTLSIDEGSRKKELIFKGEPSYGNNVAYARAHVSSSKSTLNLAPAGAAWMS